MAVEIFETGRLMLASLPMYDMPEVRDATDALWAAIAQAYGTDIRLTRADDWTATWNQADLLLSQTCGYPFTHAYASVLTYVATPHYAADGCDGPNYRSILMARRKAELTSFEGQTAAFNSRDSMSGMLALQLAFAPLAKQGIFFGTAIETGSHASSLAAVQSGTADICAVDCVTLALLRRYRPQAVENLCEVGRTPSVPGLPLVTRIGDVVALQHALVSVMEDTKLQSTRDALLLRGISMMDAQSYALIPTLERDMLTLGGTNLW